MYLESISLKFQNHKHETAKLLHFTKIIFKIIMKVIKAVYFCVFKMSHMIYRCTRNLMLISKKT